MLSASRPTIPKTRLPLAPHRHPQAAEVEVVVIGPGRGECVLVHIGGGDWIIVDSCQPGGRRRRHPALAFLEDIEADLTRVLLVVATHWHDDHIRGLDLLVEACPNARIVLSSALGTDELVNGIGGFPKLDLVNSDTNGGDGADGADGGDGGDGKTHLTSGVEMLQRVVARAERDAAAESDRPYRLVPAGADTVLIEDPPEQGRPARTVVALSPSPRQQLEASRAIAELIDQAMRDNVATVPQPDRNPSAVVLWARVGDATVLLAADLEHEFDRHRGWQAVLDCTTLAGRAEVVKASHHGAASGHDAEAWTALTVELPLVLVAPWRAGGKVLPEVDDIARMRADSDVVLQSAPAGPEGVRRRSDGRLHVPHGSAAGRVLVRRTVALSHAVLKDRDGGWSAAMQNPGFQHP